MFIFLSKFLPLFVYPVGLACLLIIMGMLAARRRRWHSASLVFALVVLFLGGNRIIAASLARSLEWRHLPPETEPYAGAIVVLGGATYAADYPRRSVEINGAGDRIFYAAQLFHAGKSDNILLTGGNIEWFTGKGDPSKDAAELLAMLGVPAEAIWLESESRNTYENALYAGIILKSHDINKILLVTSALHMPRAVAIFERQGFDVIPAPADFRITEANWSRLWEPNLADQIVGLVPSAENLALTTIALKEYLGLLVYWLRGWL